MCQAFHTNPTHFPQRGKCQKGAFFWIRKQRPWKASKLPVVMQLVRGLSHRNIPASTSLLGPIYFKNLEVCLNEWIPSLSRLLYVFLPQCLGSMRSRIFVFITCWIPGAWNSASTHQGCLVDIFWINEFLHTFVIYCFLFNTPPPFKYIAF